MNARACIVMLLVALVSGLYAKTPAPVSSDELDFNGNLEYPVVPSYARADVVKHARSLADHLKEKGFDASTLRDGEVVLINLPCDELFAPNDTLLKPAAVARLEYLGPFLRQPSMYKVMVSVNSDDAGDDVYSDRLTDLRAFAIEDLFVKVSGMDNPNTISEGRGKNNFIVPNNSMANRARNRRVEIYIVPDDGLVKAAKAHKL